MVYGEQWEYKVVSIDVSSSSSYHNTEKILNSLGFQGWELVSVTDKYTENGGTAYLKRKIG